MGGGVKVAFFWLSGNVGINFVAIRTRSAFDSGGSLLVHVIVLKGRSLWLKWIVVTVPSAFHE